MPIARPNRIRRALATFLLALGTGLAGFAATPANTYRAADRLPATVRRVAVLPVTVEPHDSLGDFGCVSLQRALLAELRQTGRFELLPVPPEDLQRWSGRSGWPTTEKLPADFLARIRQATGADAVLFCHLSQYRPYPPVAIGWKLQLVDATQGNVLWAADVVFDAADPHVAASAKARASNLDRLLGGSGILLSPSRFGQYAAAVVLRTLPLR